VRPNKPREPEEKYKYIVLTLAVPSAADAVATLLLVAGVLQLADALCGPKPALAGLRPESKNKLRKRREEVDEEIREESEREAREAEKLAKEDALAAKRSAEKERVGTLSAAEQQKVRFFC
jgi:hypothetical protein